MKRSSQTLMIGAALAVSVVTALAAGGAGELKIKTLSTDASRVTGGDVLVEIDVPTAISRQAVKVTLAVTAAFGLRDVLFDGVDITKQFHNGAIPNTLVGLVTGLSNGKNILKADVTSKTPALLEITNYPITGPVFSGPWIQPFICQTEDYALPDGSKLGKPLDANCSAKTVVQYVYFSGGKFKPLPSTTSLPADVVKTTTTDGAVVNFIVRVETGTMNRGIYQNVILHDPTVDPPPTPFAPPKGWNKRLIAMHGSGCPSGWYLQGDKQGVNILDPARLSQGYALFINTLNHPTNSCNAVLAGETATMGKEHFIETFGVPFYTMSTGGSGGAYTSLQLADAFPGLFDGVMVSATFPDALAIASSGLDAHLLTHYFTVTNPDGLTEAQKVAISGYSSMQAFIDAANQAQRTDPVPDRKDIEGYQSARWNKAVPAELRYDPVKNPQGARPTVFDAAHNVYGKNPASGAALRPWDNTGVQYGLSALNAGTITKAQFLDLNEKIGGYDQDANYTAARAVGDLSAIKRTYQSGLMLSGSGGLSSIPVFDNATSRESSGYHYGWFHFALRDRIRQANGGNSDNMVMWRSVSGNAGQMMFDKWMTAYKSDTSNDPQRVKVLRAKPKEGVEGCYDKSMPPKFIAENLTFTSEPLTDCGKLYPVYSNPRKEAGGPLAANIMKCQLKPVDAKDYKVPFTGADLTRLKAIFPAGVCDWSKPGVNQVPVVPWASFGPSPKNLVFDVGKP